jgi:phosphoserine phosphatase
LSTPLPPSYRGADVVFFDCDSTLSTIEGVDELARRRGVDVARLTADAMAGLIPLNEVYAARLERIAPTTEDFIWLADLYAQTEVPGARAAIEALSSLGIDCHVISGGLLPAVQPFALALGIAPDRVHAVPYPVDHADPAAVAIAHPLARNGGKPEVVAQVCTNGPARERRMIVGDGSSDLEARVETGLFVGFGGVEAREKVREGADLFLESEGLWAVAGLAAGPDRFAELEDVAPRTHHQSMIDLPILRNWMP